MSCLALSVAFFMATMRELCSLALAFQQNLVNLEIEVMRQQRAKDFFDIRLEQKLGCTLEKFFLHGMTMHSRDDPFDLADRQKRKNLRLLIERRNKVRE